MLELQKFVQLLFVNKSISVFIKTFEGLFELMMIEGLINLSGESDILTIGYVSRVVQI